MVDRDKRNTDAANADKRYTSVIVLRNISNVTLYYKGVLRCIGLEWPTALSDWSQMADLKV